MPKSPTDEAVFAKLIEKAWTSPAFKQRLLTEPEAVFAEAGLPVPAGKKIQVLEESNTLGYFILPSQPGGGGLSDVELDAVAGGTATQYTRVNGMSKYGLFMCK